MQEAIGANPWRKGAFLSERDAVSTSTSDPESLKEAEADLEAWQQGTLFDDEKFVERLTLLGLSREDFLGVLADAEMEHQPAVDTSEWAPRIEEIISGKYASAHLPELSFPHSDGENQRSGGENQALPFEGLAALFLQAGFARFRAGLSALRERHALGGPPLREEVCAELYRELTEQILQLATPMLTLELNVARMMDELEGTTPQDRFEYYSKTLLAKPEKQRSILREYPVFARLALAAIEHWLEASLELFEHFFTDRALLEERFGFDNSLGRLSSIQVTASDYHNRGRRVVIFVFDQDLKLVYKPKPLATELEFQRLLGLLNNAGLKHPHRLLTVVNRGSYGWVEFVSTEDCSKTEEIDRFYRRQGSFLAVLYMLRAVDFHYENVIAAGEFPVLIDLESILHHGAPEGYGETAIQRCKEILESSVMNVGLLPMRLWRQDGGKGVDLSGLGTQEGQMTLRPVPKLENRRTDSMRIVREKAAMEGGSNLPRLKGEEVGVHGFKSAVVEGFRESYALFIEHKETLSDRLRSYADLEVRQILRPTHQYGAYLQEGRHPDYLRDGLDRDRLLDWLWSRTTETPSLAAVVPSEQDDLRFGDIPFFTAKAGERHLWDSRGRRIESFFTEDSLSSALERLEGMNLQDLEYQTGIVRNSLISLDASKLYGAPARAPELSPDAELPTSTSAALKEQLFECAITLGEALKTQAVYGKGENGNRDVCWIGVSFDGDSHEDWVLAPCGTSLYDGVGGVAFFLGHLAAATGRDDFKELSLIALETVKEQMRWNEIHKPDSGIVGGFAGLAADLYVLHHFSALFDAPEHLDEILSALPRLERLIATESHLDIIGGCAGGAVVLLDVYRRTGERKVLEVARLCGERLLRTAVPCDGGVGWQIPSEDAPLGGFSHGTAGISWALCELTEATGDERFWKVGEQAIAYERGLFVPELGNWRDKRQEAEEARAKEAPDALPVTWCHGAPGVVLGRSLVLSHIDDPRLREEITIGAETTMHRGFGLSHCLCHGDLGNADVLYVASDAVNEPLWKDAALERVRAILPDLKAGYWRCGLPERVEGPSLMTGLAGIGYQLLRLSAPERHPSVLCLGPPVAG